MSDASATSGPSPVGWTSAVWATEACADAVRSFVAGALGVRDGADGVRLEPFHVRPWSSVWTATTPDGRRWYVKQNAPPQSHETRLVLRLTAVAPEDVVPVAGADVERDLLPRVRGWGEEVAALGLPLTLNHNDLHAANALVDDGTASGLRFFDFGDCVRTEPLAVLAVPLGVLAEEWGSPHDPRLHRVLDAALEVWSDLAPVRALRAAAPAAVRLGRLARAESWRRLTTVMTAEERAAVGSAEAESVAQLLGPAPTGAREHDRRADG